MNGVIFFQPNKNELPLAALAVLSKIFLRAKLGFGGEPVAIGGLTEFMRSSAGANKNAERYATVQSEVIAAQLLKVCPSAKKNRSAEAHSTVRKRGYELPHISVARRDFDRYLGCNIDWT